MSIMLKSTASISLNSLFRRWRMTAQQEMELSIQLIHIKK